jgi:hypothetical protein
VVETNLSPWSAFEPYSKAFFYLPGSTYRTQETKFAVLETISYAVVLKELPGSLKTGFEGSSRFPTTETKDKRC